MISDPSVQPGPETQQPRKAVGLGVLLFFTLLAVFIAITSMFPLQGRIGGTQFCIGGNATLKLFPNYPWGPGWVSYRTRAPGGDTMNVHSLGFPGGWHYAWLSIHLAPDP